MTGKTCDLCGDNTPYTDWNRCELCVAVTAIAGKERTAEQHARRAQWDRRMQAKLQSGNECDRILAVGHARSATAYEQRAVELQVPAS